MNQEQKKTLRTIDETLLIPILEDGRKLYHYTSAVGITRNLWLGNFGSRKDLF